MRRIDIDRDQLGRALIAANGFIGRAARRLRVCRAVVWRRVQEAGMLEAADQLRRATGWRGGAPRV